MTLSEARALRDEIRAAGLRSTVPLGHGPDGCFVLVITRDGPCRILSHRQWHEMENKLCPQRQPSP